MSNQFNIHKHNTSRITWYHRKQKQMRGISCINEKFMLAFTIDETITRKHETNRQLQLERLIVETCDAFNIYMQHTRKLLIVRLISSVITFFVKKIS